MPSAAQVHQALEERVQQQWTATPVAYDNTNLESLSAGTAPFLRVCVHWGETVQAAFGHPRTFRTYGVLICYLQVRVGTGSRTAATHLTALQDLFLGHQFAGITCPRVRVLEAREEAGWQVTPIHVSFWFDEQK